MCEKTGEGLFSVELPVPDEDFYQIKDVPHGSVRREYFFSSVTGEWESCTVYTPAEYEEQTDKIYPVLYLQHGHGENETGWTTAGSLQFILENLIAEGVDTFVEIGPGRTLAGFMRKISRDVTVYNVGAWADVEKVAQALK